MNREYCQVVIEGSFDLMKGFVVGILEGKGIQGEAIFSEEHHVENESAFGQMLRLIGGRGNRFRLIIGTGFFELFKESLERRSDELALKIVSEKRIRQASFGFRFRAYTRELGSELKGLFGNPPEGLRVKDYHPAEKVLPEGKGMEAYAPLHEYDVKANGTIYGPVRDVMDFYGRVEHYDMVKLDKIKLEYDNT